MPWGNQDQEQDQGQAQGQAEAQLQGQLQGQGQGQSQEQSSSSENGNLNGNGNGNLNGNANGNLNYNSNAAANAAHNGASNWTSNSSENSSDTDTDVETTVTTTVDVISGIDLDGYMPTDDDFGDINMSGSATIDTILVGKGDISFDPGNEQNIEDLLNDALNGAGNDTGTINSQFNNLVDSDVLSSASVGGNLQQTNTSTGGSAASDDGIGVGSDDVADAGWDFHMKGGGHGGDDDDGALGASSGNWGSGNGDDGFVSGESLSSAASAIDTTAFNQSIVMGANVLGNTVDMSVVGGNMSSTYVGDDSSDGAA